MSISKMSLVEIVTPRKLTDDLLICLQDFGAVHLEEVPLVVPGVRSYLHRLQLTDEEEHDLALCRETLRMLSELLPLFKGESWPEDADVSAFQSELPSNDSELMNLRVSRLKRRADSLWRKQANISNDIKTLESYRTKLGQLNAIKESSNFSESMKYLALLIAPEQEERLQYLESTLNGITKQNFSVLRTENDKKSKTVDNVDVVVLAFPEEYETDFQRAVRQSGIPEFRMPRQARDLPLMEAAETLKQLLETLPDKLAEVTKQVNDFKSENFVAAVAIDAICHTTVARLEAKSNFAHSEMITVSQGWVPSKELPAMRSKIGSEIGEEVVITELPTSEKSPLDVPVRLKNAKAFKPFEHLVRLFSNPLYGSFDPTALIAVVFPIFFGLILGDAAYGLAIAGLGLYARRRWRHIEAYKDIAMVAIWCGLSSVVFGIIFGEFLGDLPHRMHWIPTTVAGIPIPVWAERKYIIGKLLMVTIAIGFFHILFGLILGVIEAIRHKDKHHLGERLGLLAGLLGIVVLAAHFDIPNKGAIGGVMLVISIVLLFKFTGPTGPIELISLVAHVLSYSRIMALGVAGMVIAEIANMMAATQEYLILQLLIAIPIHLLALVLGMLEPSIHALRLHFVEFLPNFFAGDGRVYAPLTKKGNSI